MHKSEVPCPLRTLCPAKGGALDPSSGAWRFQQRAPRELSPKGHAHLVGPSLSAAPTPISSHFGAEKKEEKVRKRQLSSRLLRKPAVGELKQRKVCRWGFSPD